jgi:hypothetical protein
MITRDVLISKTSQAIAEKLAEERLTTPEDLAIVALDAIMGEVASPLCSAVESVSPFGKIIADQIRSIAGQE